MFRTALTKTALRAPARSLAKPVLIRAYHEKVISHYENPRNVSPPCPPPPHVHHI
jgi:hypothetical protein